MRLILLLISIALFTLQSYAQNRYRTECLHAIANATGMISLTDTISEGIHHCASEFKGHPVNIYQKSGEIYHIGYAIFPDSCRNEHNYVVFDFLERYTLQSDLSIDKSRNFNTKMNEDEVYFSKGNIASLKDCFGLATLSFSIRNENDQRYFVSFCRNGKEFCSLNFPINHNLLNETRMLEDEEKLMSDLMAFKLGSISVPEAPASDSAYVTQFNNNSYLFILKGKSFILPYISSNLYYQYDESKGFELIHDRNRPVESVANMLLTSAVENDFDIEVDYRRYAYKDSCIVLKLNDFIGYFLKSGCKGFFAAKSLEGNIVNCMVLMHKSDEGYAHLLNIEIDITGIDRKQGWSRCKLHSYLPLNKVKNLFADN